MRLLADIRTTMMNDEVAKEICREEGVDEWLLVSVPILFEDLEVAAKTTDGSISLSTKLLDKPPEIRMRYVIHELVHAIQHIKDFGKPKSDEAHNYLDEPDEVAAFQKQIKYHSKELGKEDAEEYVDDLLDHHNVPGEDKKDKREELLEEAV